MGYKSDRKIEKQLNKQAKKLQKANAKIEKQNEKIEKSTAKLDEQTEKLQNNNLPAKEVGGFRKFLNKWKFRIGLGVVGILGIASIPNEKSNYPEELDNNKRIESESLDEKETTSETKEKYTHSIKEINVETGTVVVEVESKEEQTTDIAQDIVEQTTDLRKELEKQTVKVKEKPEVEKVDSDTIFEKGKEALGLEKREETPLNSVTTNTGGKMDVEKIEPESQLQTKSEETTKTVIDLDNEEEIPNADEKEGMDLVIEHDKEDNVSIEDGTIIIEGNDNGEIVIGFEQETISERPSEIEVHEQETVDESHFIENPNPFDDWER